MYYQVNYTMKQITPLTELELKEKLHSLIEQIDLSSLRGYNKGDCSWFGNVNFGEVDLNDGSYLLIENVNCYFYVQNEREIVSIEIYSVEICEQISHETQDTIKSFEYLF